MKLSKDSPILEVDYTDGMAPFHFGNSLHKSGFTVVRNHPIDWELINNLYSGWADFFNSDEKVKYSCDPNKPEGFFPLRIEKGIKNDLKECFYFYPWSACPSYLYKTTMSVYNNLLILAEEFLSWLVEHSHAGLRQSIIIKTKQAIHATGGTLRILHYPALTEISTDLAASNTERLVPHKDISLLTILPVATNPGLEILDNKDEWHTIKCKPETVIVNSGNMLSSLTNNYFKSTLHRVSILDDVIAKNTPRYSCAFFLTVDTNLTKSLCL